MVSCDTASHGCILGLGSLATLEESVSDDALRVKAAPLPCSNLLRSCPSGVQTCSRCLVQRLTPAPVH